MVATCPYHLQYMVAVAQLVERQFVELNVAGSSPVSHPSFSSYFATIHV